jgi:hypothetical protein
MASIHKEIAIERSKEFVWDAIRDVGAIHKRLVPGFVVDCKLEGDSRIVTFANGMVVRELIVDVDDKTCRHSWSARGEPLTHHNCGSVVRLTAVRFKRRGSLGATGWTGRRRPWNCRRTGPVLLSNPFGAPVGPAHSRQP